MQRRTSIQVSSLIILLSMITILLQFTAYYFFTSQLIISGAAILLSVISCVLLTEQTGAYEACFNYSVLTMFISLTVTVMSSLSQDRTFLPYSGVMPGIVCINWLIPNLFCSIRNMTDNGSRFEDYPSFYKKDCILFFVIYLTVILYAAFHPAALPFARQGSLTGPNFIPFEAITIQIEDYLYGETPLNSLLIYLLWRILLWVPYGFQVTLTLRRKSRLARFLSLLALPALLEILQYIIIPSRFDIDDMIYAVLGGLLGSVFYFLYNRICRAVTGKDFLENEHSYSGSGIHF